MCASSIFPAVLSASSAISASPASLHQLANSSMYHRCASSATNSSGTFVCVEDAWDLWCLRERSNQVVDCACFGPLADLFDGFADPGRRRVLQLLAVD